MSYTPHSGPFFVGLITSDKTGPITETTINYDEFRTSLGLYASTSLTMSGLAYTDVISEVGAGTNMYGQHTPKSGYGYGADMKRDGATRAYAGAIGCANLSTDPVILRYKGLVDSNDVIKGSHIYII
jgi:hypothetical protein